MHENKTLYIADLDGTLLNQNAELSRHTTDALNRLISIGLNFSVATARTAATAFKILEFVQWKVPIVLLNGALIYDVEQKRYVQVLSLSPQIVAKIISTLQGLNMTGLMYQLKNSEQITYYETLGHKPLRDFMEERIIRYNKIFNKVNFKDVPSENIIYFTMIDTHDKIQPAHSAFSGIPGICLSMYKDTYSSDLWYLEIHNDKATKQNGTLYLKEHYGFERIVGFGDNLNDLPLFAACDLCVAVENAKDEVKAASDFVCGTNESDGVVKWIEEWMLK